MYLAAMPQAYCIPDFAWGWHFVEHTYTFIFHSNAADGTFCPKWQAKKRESLAPMPSEKNANWRYILVC